MKNRISTLLFALGFIVLSCSNNDEDDNTSMQFQSTATISGFDMTLCGCCGGWIINIDNEVSDKRFSTLPQDSNIDLENSTFPINVQLNWTESDDYCGNGITIDSIELAE